MMFSVPQLGQRSLLASSSSRTNGPSAATTEARSSVTFCMHGRVDFSPARRRSHWRVIGQFRSSASPNVVAVANPDAMPVILRTPEEIEIWMTAPWEEAQKLQRPLPDGVLQVVSVGPKEDPPPSEPDEPEPSLF